MYDKKNHLLYQLSQQCQKMQKKIMISYETSSQQTPGLAPTDHWLAYSVMLRTQLC